MLDEGLYVRMAEEQIMPTLTLSHDKYERSEWLGGNCPGPHYEKRTIWNRFRWLLRTIRCDNPFDCPATVERMRVRVCKVESDLDWGGTLFMSEERPRYELFIPESHYSSLEGRPDVLTVTIDLGDV